MPMIDVSLLRIMNNYANPKAFPLLLTQGLLELLFVIVVEVLLCYFVNYFHLMA